MDGPTEHKLTPADIERKHKELDLGFTVIVHSMGALRQLYETYEDDLCHRLVGDAEMIAVRRDDNGVKLKGGLRYGTDPEKALETLEVSDE